MMNIKNHGDWEIYKPEKLPKDAPPNALFACRVSDGVDWYDYVNAGNNFQQDTIKMTMINGRVAVASADPTLLFPAQATVLEVSDVSVSDPQKLFGGKIYDTHAKDFRDPEPYNYPNPLDDLMQRVKALEQKSS